MHLGLEPEPWLSQRFIASLIWLYRVYRRLREKCQRKKEMESLMKEIYFGLRFDNLYSLFPPMSSARFLFFFFSLLFHNFFSISSTCLLWWCRDKILGRLKPLKWFIAIETRCNSALRPEIKYVAYKSYIKESPQRVVPPNRWTHAAFRSHGQLLTSAGRWRGLLWTLWQPTDCLMSQKKEMMYG